MGSLPLYLCFSLLGRGMRIPKGCRGMEITYIESNGAEKFLLTHKNEHQNNGNPILPFHYDQTNKPLGHVLTQGNEEWEWMFHSFYHSFPYLDNLNDNGNGIKNDSNRNEIPLTSGISNDLQE